jgi:hypothetical protein
MRDDPGPLQRYPIRREARREAPPRRTVRLTPVRVLVIVAVVASFGLIAYGFVRRDSSQIPILAAGLIILALTLVGAGFWSAFGAYREARRGRFGWAFAGALVGGLCVLAGTVALASAIVLSLIWRNA